MTAPREIPEHVREHARRCAWRKALEVDGAALRAAEEAGLSVGQFFELVRAHRPQRARQRPLFDSGQTEAPQPAPVRCTEPGRLRVVIPGQPVPKLRGRAVVLGDGSVRVVKPQKTRRYEARVRAAGKAVAPAQPLAGPLKARFEVCLGVPPSWATWRREAALAGRIRPTGRGTGDADNFAKALADGLNGVAWADDSQLVEVSVVLRYAAEPRAVVEVEPLPSEPSSAVEWRAETGGVTSG